MKRFGTAAILTTILAGAAFASDPGSPRTAKAKGPTRFVVREVTTQPPPLPAVPQNLPELAELAVSPVLAVVKIGRELSADPAPEQVRGLRKAREEMHRFWMNNQPSVLTYKRLSGAIGP